MTSKPPLHRLTDVLRRNSPESLQRNAEDLAWAASSLHPSDTATRFQRNARLVSPKSLRLLLDATVLSRWSVFGVYKPPFCPMRRSEAHNNHHRVSLESFIDAALRSRDVQSALQREAHLPAAPHVRVAYDMQTHTSGPVVITVADHHNFSTSLAPYTMRYDVLLMGHAPLGDPIAIVPSLLYPDCDAIGSCTCSYQVRRNAYYAVHPVSLVELTITAPPTPRPPQIEQFARDTLGTFVVGDPLASHKQEMKSTQSSSSRFRVAAMHGDCDFPRVFTHLREVAIAATVKDIAGDAAGAKVLDFHCRNCFEPVLQRERVYSLKGRRIGLLDGSWTPDAEFL